MEEMITVVVTGHDKNLLLGIARSLLERRLVACAQILGPMESIYWWKGKIEEAAEWIVLMKTRKALYDAVEGAIVNLHTYEVPEVVSFPIERCLPSYGRWLEEETTATLKVL